VFLNIGRICFWKLTLFSGIVLLFEFNEFCEQAISKRIIKQQNKDIVFILQIQLIKNP
jgi:hypothetical protein